MKKLIIMAALLLGMAHTAFAEQQGVYMHFYRNINPEKKQSVNRTPMRLPINVVYDSDTHKIEVIGDESMDAEVDLYRDYNVKLYNKCSTLSDSQIENYSKDLNILIDNSHVSQNQKEKLSQTADLTINSALYWNSNY